MQSALWYNPHTMACSLIIKCRPQCVGGGLWGVLCLVEKKELHYWRRDSHVIVFSSQHLFVLLIQWYCIHWSWTPKAPKASSVRCTFVTCKCAVVIFPLLKQWYGNLENRTHRVIYLRI